MSLLVLDLSSVFPQTHSYARRVQDRKSRCGRNAIPAPITHMPDKNSLPAADQQTRNKSEDRAEPVHPVEQNQRLEALAHLSGEVAHDVNNALQVIKSVSEILRRRLPSNEKDIAGLVDMLTRNSDRVASLMRRLLAFSGRLSHERKTLNANELIGDMADQFQEDPGSSRVDVEVLLGRGLWWISVDPGELQAALLNLAINGREALSQGGTLTLETANVSIDKRLTMIGSAAAPGEYVSIAVRDNGVGMTPEVMARVFDPYFTTKETGHGVGLGLSQVYGFVKQSNGHIEIHSTPGGGTKVTLYFPRVSAPDIAYSSGVREAPPTRLVVKGAEAKAARGLAGLRVLVVEDASPVGMLAEGLLDQLGCNMVGLVSNVQKALEMAEREKIQLALLDVDLGGEPVYPVAEALQARGIPFVFMSGYGRLEQPWNNRPIIQKPFELAELKSAIEIALGGAL